MYIRPLHYLQAPLRLKGLLIGLWYASLSVDYLFVSIAELFLTDSTAWEVFHMVKVFFIFLSLMSFLCVSRRFRYRLRDEVVNEQFLVEEIYERELKSRKQDDEDSLLETSTYSISYGTM